MLIDLCGGRLFADQYGDESPRVVALHGWGRSRSDWASVLMGLEALAVDLPGFGRSAAPRAAWDTRQYAAELADCLNEDRLTIVGHSFGGRVAVQFAAAYPARVKSLVLTGVPLLHRSDRRAKASLPYRLIRQADRAGIVPASMMEAARKKYGSPDYRAAEGVMRSILVSAVNEEYSQQLAAIRRSGVETFLVWGANDTAVPVELARRAARLLGETCDLDVVPGSGHLLDGPLSLAIRTRIDQTLASEKRRGGE